MIENIIDQKVITDKYSKGIFQLVNDLNEEVKTENKSGIISEISKMNSSEEEIYSFLKNEGYDISYKDYKLFYNDSLKAFGESENEISKVMRETYETELSENDLESVAGGKLSFKKLGLSIGAALVIGGIVVATGGVAAVAIVVAAGATGATGVVAGGLAAVVIGGVAAGSGAAVEVLDN